MAERLIILDSDIIYRIAEIEKKIALQEVLQSQGWHAELKGPEDGALENSYKEGLWTREEGSRKIPESGSIMEDNIPQKKNEAPFMACMSVTESK